MFEVVFSPMTQQEQPPVKLGISLKVIWLDEVEDLLEVAFSWSNGFFSGKADIYVSCRHLSNFADALTRFPSRPDDIRDFELGTVNPEHADGGVRMYFLCEDAAGDAVVKVKLRGDACKALGEVQSVALRFPIQAAGVDEFIKQLRGIVKTFGASASVCRRQDLRLGSVKEECVQTRDALRTAPDVRSILIDSQPDSRLTP